MNDRRTFLKTAGMTATLGLGLGPVAGCFKQSRSDQVSVSSERGGEKLGMGQESGIVEAIYLDAESKLTVSLERVEVLIKSEEHTLNFPGYLTFEQKDVLVYGQGRHGGLETYPAVVSTDLGKTWNDAPLESPYRDKMFTSGLHCWMKDGTYLYMETYPFAFDWMSHGIEKYWTYRLTEFKWRLRRFSPQGDLMETSTTELLGLPWKTVSRFEIYGTILELDNGDLLAPFLVTPDRPDKKPNNSVVIARSTDRAKTFRYESHFSHEVDGQRIGDVGASEPDLALLPNGDILCIMRSGSRTPLYQARSTDGGRTWSKQVSTGWPGVKPKLRVLNNGVLVCSTGRGAYGQPQVTCLMVSIDGTGERWEAPFNFHTGPGCSYTWNIERNGRLEVIYSHSSFTKPIGTYGLPFQSIRRAIFDIRKEKRT